MHLAALRAAGDRQDVMPSRARVRIPLYFLGAPSAERVMVRSAESLEAQLLTLPPADHARLAELLIASLDAEVETGPVSEIEADWRQEGERRLAELRSGSVAGVPAAQVFAEASARLTR